MKISPIKVYATFLLKKATIQHPPRKLGLFIDQLPIKLEKIIRIILNSIYVIQKNPESVEDMRYATRGWVSSFDLSYLKEKMISGWDPLTKSVKDLQRYSYQYKQNNDSRIRSQLLNTIISLFETIQDRWHGQSDPYRKATKELASEGWKDSVEDPAFAQHILKITISLIELEKISEEVPRKLKETLRLLIPSFANPSEPDRPASEDIETLFHASINAREIYRSERESPEAYLGDESESYWKSFLTFSTISFRTLGLIGHRSSPRIT